MWCSRVWLADQAPTWRLRPSPWRTGKHHTYLAMAARDDAGALQLYLEAPAARREPGVSFLCISSVPAPSRPGPPPSHARQLARPPILNLPASVAPSAASDYTKYTKYTLDPCQPPSSSPWPTAPGPRATTPTATAMATAPRATGPTAPTSLVVDGRRKTIVPGGVSRCRSTTTMATRSQRASTPRARVAGAASTPSGSSSSAPRAAAPRPCSSTCCGPLSPSPLPWSVSLVAWASHCTQPAHAADPSRSTL